MPGNGLTGRQRLIVENELARLIAHGIPISIAAPTLGISASTIIWWRQEAKRRPEYRRTIASLDAARHERRQAVEELLAEARRNVQRTGRAPAPIPALREHQLRARPPAA